MSETPGQQASSTPPSVQPPLTPDPAEIHTDADSQPAQECLSSFPEEDVAALLRRFLLTLEEVRADRRFAYMLKKILDDKEYIDKLREPIDPVVPPPHQMKFYPPSVMQKYADRYKLSPEKLGDRSIGFLIKSKVDSDQYILQLKREIEEQQSRVAFLLKTLNTVTQKNYVGFKTKTETK